MKVRITDEGVNRTYGFAKYLHDSLPNATYVGFTGTPIDATLEVFGDIVGHPYTMTEAVKDEITVNLVYDGRAAKVTRRDDKLREIEEYYDKCATMGSSEEQIEESQKAESQKAVAHLDAIIGDTDRLKALAKDFVAHYEKRDEAFANEVLDDVVNQLADLIHELKQEKNSFEKMGIDYEEKAFFDILLAVSKKYEFEYPKDKMIELAKEIKIVVEDKAKYPDFSTREDIKAHLQVDLILLLDKYDYPPVTIGDVYKEVL